MDDDAAVERLAVRGGDLVSDHVFRLTSGVLYRVVHQKRCVDVAKSPGVLAAEVELTKDVSLWEESTDGVLQLTSRCLVTELG